MSLLFLPRVYYVGSANLTGAGMGMKSPHRRNFEAGILTDEPSIVSAACGFNLEHHHHALADAEACARIAMEIL